MRPHIYWLTILFSLGVFDTASAEGWLQRLLGSTWQQSQNVDMNGCPRPCGPDDYCRKPFPCIRPILPCGECDDYCPKPFPCVSPPAGCRGPDDYCRKPVPCLLCPFRYPYLNCGSMPPGCQRRRNVNSRPNY